jgi:hypothetical protein
MIFPIIKTLILHTANVHILLFSLLDNFDLC